jgi:hypothetical protein
MLRLLSPTISGQLRHVDPGGAGWFGASRIGRRHTGVDFVAAIGEDIRAPAKGTISRIGWPYADDLSYRLIDLAIGDLAIIRIFYVDPVEDLEVGHLVVTGQTIGYAQDIVARYPNPPGMQNHVHVALALSWVKGALLGKTGAVDPNNRLYVDPTLFMEGLQ